MKKTEILFRNAEENTPSEQKFGGVISALENFGGGAAATEELKKDLNISEPQAQTSEPQTQTQENANTVEQVNAMLGRNEAEPTAPVEPPVANNTEEPPVVEQTPAATDETLKIESEIFEGGALTLGGENKEKKDYSEDITKFVSSEFGFESPTELKNKLEEYKTLSSQVDELKGKLDGNNRIFEQMPKELYNAITAYFNKDGDWKSKISNDGIDYMKSVEDYRTEELVNSFFPGQFSEADWEEYKDPDGDPNIKRAIDLAKNTSTDKFMAKQNDITSYQQNVQARQQQTAQAMNSSIEMTINNLPSQMNGLSESYVKSVESKIRNNEILGLFYNQDGTLKPDAAHRFVLAQDGSNLLDQYAKLYKVQAKNEATQELLDRTADTPDRTQGGSSTPVTDNRTKAEKVAGSLTDRFLGGKKTF